MITVDPEGAEFSDSWQEEDRAARWRSAPGHSPSEGAEASGSSLLEVEPGHHLPRHTDSAEKIVIVLGGSGELIVGDERTIIPAGGLAIVPKCVPHEVRNTGPISFASPPSTPSRTWSRRTSVSCTRTARPNGTP